jgi:hypothetical protein
VLLNQRSVLLYVVLEVRHTHAHGMEDTFSYEVKQCGVLCVMICWETK